MISSRQYLADSAATAESVRAFMAEIESLGTEPTPAEMRQAGPGLRAPLATTSEFSVRLGAARLNDARLESQRADTAAALDGLVESMQKLTGFVEQGDRRRAAALTIRVADRAEALRRAAGDP